MRFDSKLYKNIIGIPMGTTCAFLVVDLLAHLSRRLYCYRFSSVVRPSVREHFL